MATTSAETVSAASAEAAPATSAKTMSTSEATATKAGPPTRGRATLNSSWTNPAKGAGVHTRVRIGLTEAAKVAILAGSGSLEVTPSLMTKVVVSIEAP